MGMSTPPVQTVHVDLADRSYDVAIGTNILESLGDVIKKLSPFATRALLALDHNLPQQTVERAAKSIKSAGLCVTQHVLLATEEHKSAPALNEMHIQMANASLDRHDIVVALGGGIVGDVAGFAAATYMRGIPVIQCPTTLLSMVDASVGGKTGINLLVHDDADTWSLLKNYVGAFWQPLAVLADVTTLQSLEPRQYISGLAECIKHALLSHQTDPDLFDWISANLDSIRTLDEQTLVELVARNVTIKARIVEADEREEATDQPGRAALNLGHTFAHVIEGLAHLANTPGPTDSPMLHGQAVALGLLAAIATSIDMSQAPPSLLEHTRQLLTDAGLPTSIPNLPDNITLRAHMLRDKKSHSGTLRLILPTAGAKVALVSDAPDKSIDAGWETIRA
jgi:3-dehydroquinate synthase